MEKVLSQGAEGKIYLTKFLDKLCLVKERFIKQYRVKELDTKLTKSRILNETRNISRASKNGIKLIKHTELMLVIVVQQWLILNLVLKIVIIIL